MPYDYDPDDKFGYKDTLPENHPEKVITGVEFDDEFKKIETAINTLEDVALGDGQFIDAPNDNQLYGRKNQDWEVVPDASGFLTDAPSDGKQYARQDSAWSVVQASNDAGAGLVISENEPADKVTGMQWLEADTGIVWIWDDGKWLQFPAGGAGGGDDYDDTQLQADVAANTVAISDNATDIAAKADAVHTHEISEVNGLKSELNFKLNIDQQVWKYYPDEYRFVSLGFGGYTRREFWALSVEPLSNLAGELSRLEETVMVQKLEATDIFGPYLKITAPNIEIGIDGQDDPGSLVAKAPAYFRNSWSVEHTVLGGINISAADIDRPDELPYGADEKSVQYALSVTHETLGRTVEIDKEGIVRANDFADIDGNSLIWKGTQSEYNALTPNDNTLYFIV